MSAGPVELLVAKARQIGFPGSQTRVVEFEYQGGHILSVRGQGTGNQYRFIGHGARVAIDARDRASLAMVPGLRERPS